MIGGLNALKKLLLLCSTIVFAFANEKFLSEKKLQTLQLQQQQAQYDAKILQKSWISPLIFSYEQNRNDTLSQNTTTKAITIDQPVFRSGGIYNAIRYGQSVRDSSLQNIQQQKHELIGAAIEHLYNYKKTQKMVAKQELLIKNNALEIETKQEQYLSGLIDSIELDRALLERNQNKTALIDLKESLHAIQTEFEKISDLDIQNTQAPRFSLLSKEQFVQNNLHYHVAQSDMYSKRYQRNMTVSAYLPEVSLYGRYSEVDNRPVNQPTAQSEYGVRVSIPLDINSYGDIQSQRLEYMQASVALEDIKRSLKAEYQQIERALGFIEQRVALTKEDKKLYKSLVQKTKDQVFVGTQTPRDLKTMQNSYAIKKLDQKIYEYEKNILLLSLYMQTYGVKE